MSSGFEAKSICILGRQPAIGLAELESLYGPENVVAGPQGTALLKIDGFNINFKNLGGTIKVARLLDIIPSSTWPECLNYLKRDVPAKLNLAEDGKFTLGVSLYGFDVPPLKLTADLMRLKKIIKDSGHSVRLVPNKTPALSSAQVLHNRLTRLGASELILIKDGKQTLFGQTLFVQDIEAYAARDQARPARDARVGMLPPKLAQIIINMAGEGIVLDPFCGSGVILQEALLMGREAIGSDIDERMVKSSEKNLQWLGEQHKNLPKYQLRQADATYGTWAGFDTVASEVFLGRPLAKIPASEELNKIIRDANTITDKFLKNLQPQLKKGARICIAAPAWISGQKTIHLPLIDHLTDIGYNRYDFSRVKNSDLVYAREGQTVARELLVLEKK